MTPTWHSYWVEKINDWSAICTYLRKNVKPGDVMTGNAYTQGIMSWCLQQTTGVSVAPPGSYALAELDRSGRNVWYVLVSSVAIDRLARSCTCTIHSVTRTPPPHSTAASGGRPRPR